MFTKNQIISEIRRTAAENGGVPLGRQRFHHETGIREGDWNGRYWARWGDALEEAGVSRNKLNEAFPEEEVLAKLSAFVSELGRFPVRTELMIKRRTDPLFPSHNVFVRHGTKAGMADRLLGYARKHRQDDVAAICEVVTKEATLCGEESVEASTELVLGSVYLIKSRRFYKIGKTNSVGRRERELTIQLPEKVALVHSISTDDPGGIEEYWHKRFAERRRMGSGSNCQPLK